MVLNETMMAGTPLNGAAAGAIVALVAAFAFFFFILLVALYIYTSLAYMAIARKARYSMPGIAWIPLVGPALITSKTAKMHWWPILLLIGCLIPYVGFLFTIAFAVFSTIWLWYTFKAVRRPGWWSILCLVTPLNLIFLGIAAWSKK
jgi:hypothetical protein